jgi:hypothetical protein
MPVSLKTKSDLCFFKKAPRNITKIKFCRVSEGLPFIEISHFFDYFFLIGLATSKLLSHFYIVCTHRLPLRRPQQPLPIRLRFLIWQQKKSFPDLENLYSVFWAARNPDFLLFTVCSV